VDAGRGGGDGDGRFGVDGEDSGAGSLLRLDFLFLNTFLRFENGIVVELDVVVAERGLSAQGLICMPRLPQALGA
jgi:hypothetical protein